MNLLENIKLKARFHKHSFDGVSSTLKCLLYVSMFIIGIIEISNIVNLEVIGWSNSKTYEVISNILLNVSYSFLGAFIFYYLVVFLPKEKTVSHSVVLVNNKILSIKKYVESALKVLNGNSEINYKDVEEFSSKKIESIFEKTTLSDPIFDWDLTLLKFRSTYEYIICIGNKIDKEIDDILKIYSHLDDDLILILTNFQQDIFQLKGGETGLPRDINNFKPVLIGKINSIILGKNNLFKYLLRFKKRYDSQYHHYYREMKKLGRL